MQGLGNTATNIFIYWCPRCGTIKEELRFPDGDLQIIWNAPGYMQPLQQVAKDGNLSFKWYAIHPSAAIHYTMSMVDMLMNQPPIEQKVFIPKAPI